ncbi:LysR substrate-binding domain-containing protein [Microbaculum marinum]|uniref:LysR substrate-binding domain-containing protein n=1 Tax=Microbaculum marinum TaxID=1764581 RepID=A0AAW9RW20_9HYPH
MTERANLPLLENDVLRTFVAIAETGSFGRAAKAVYRTPSAVSMQIRKLEDTLGRSVFVRDGRSIRITTEGEALLGYARRMLRLSDEAVGLFLTPEIEGVVRIGSPDDYGTRFLPNILCRFARTHPGVDVDVTLDMSGTLYEMIENDQLDIALMTASREAEVLRHGQIVYTEPLGWAGLECGCAYEARPLPVALSPHGCPWRATALAALESAGIEARTTYRSLHTSGLLAAVHADLAISPISQSLIVPPLERLDERHGLPPLDDYHIVMHRRPALGPAGEALARHVIDSFRDISRGGRAAAAVEPAAELMAS